MGRKLPGYCPGRNALWPFLGSHHSAFVPSISSAWNSLLHPQTPDPNGQSCSSFLLSWSEPPEQLCQPALFNILVHREADSLLQAPGV